MQATPDVTVIENAGPNPHRIEQDLAWLREFEKERGRPLRVLHIGNIANNAYNNAKIQRERGIDADVLSFDYYHIMATPEWEDADFSGDLKDDFFPDWWAADLRGFRRPRWFVAGPLDVCIRYLLAKTADKPSANRLWFWLAFERWLISRRSKWRDRVQQFIRRFTGSNAEYLVNPANAILLKSLGSKLERVSRHWSICNTFAGRWLRYRARRMLRFGTTAYLAEGTQHYRAMRRNVDDISARCKWLLQQAGRADAPDDFSYFYVWWWHPYISLLFARYDIVQGYATYTALPFISGLRKYVAYEHGTIRKIPFEPTLEGRMCMATYRAASAVFITNIDNLEAAEKMRLDPERITCLPHAFDSDKLVRFTNASGVVPPGADKVATFVTPARQHWVDNDPGWAKGNDRVFDALRLVKDRGRHCRLRAVAWGQDLEASRVRVAALGIEDMVEWVPTMKKKELWLEYLNAHAVVDQFIVPAFGGVTFEAMMFGRRVITHIDTKSAARFFDAAPPLYSCQTAEEICEAMLRVIEDPSDLAGDGNANRVWMDKFHSADRIVALQSAAYQKVLDTPEPQAWLTEVLPAAWRQTVKPFLIAKGWDRTSSGRDIVMLVVSALRIDPRVEREARALVKAGWQVTIIAPDISSPPLSDIPVDWGSGVKFHLLPPQAADYVMEAPWLASENMYQAAMTYRPFAFHCHDLNTALIGLRAAKDTGARCICDFHEWYSENVSWNATSSAWEPHERGKRFLYRWIERLALRRADKVITVGDTIARELEVLGRRPAGSVGVIRNIPSLVLAPTREYSPLKQQLGLPETIFVVLYQGGTGPSRMLEPVIRALAYAPKVTFVIRGPSLDLFGDDYRKVAEAAGVSDRLILCDPLPSRDVVAAARGADAGLWTLPNLSKNFYLALPNKIFEYLAADLPLLVANFPEAERIAVGMDVGLSFDPYDPLSIAQQMNRFADDPDFSRRCQAAVGPALNTLDANAEWDKLARLYEEL